MIQVFATHNPVIEIRNQSSSGGIFTIIAERTIREGGVVYGAVFGADWQVEHNKAESIDALKAMRGSKYVFSDFLRAVKAAVADLDQGRKVLFSGTPCQVAAMRKRAGDNPLLLLVEVVCHGAPHPEYWTRYLDEICHSKGKTLTDVSTVNFRDKCTGWENYSFTVEFKDGSRFTQLHDDNLYMRAFLHDLTLRETCFHCHFKYPGGSVADITLGDLWGISKLAPELDDHLGTSLVVARTITGKTCLSEIEIPRKSIDFGEASKYNPALIQSVKKPDCYDDFTREAAASQSVIKTFRKYVSVPLILKIKQTIYRLLHK